MKIECPNVDLEAEHRKFLDHWTDKSGRGATKASRRALLDRTGLRAVRANLRSHAPWSVELVFDDVDAAARYVERR